MCLEDLRLARGYQSGPPVLIVSGSLSLVLRPDARRVAIIVANFIPNTGDVITLGSTEDQSSMFVSFNANYGPWVLRIQDYGQLITGAIYQNSVSGIGDNWYITPIYTNVSAPPAFTCEDLNKKGC